jgi:ATPase family associated with various cellular activities (AAA)/AAA+ lid domain
MNKATLIHDFKTLVLSLHPVIAVETVEEERMCRLVNDVAADLGIPVFDWSITQGLVKLPSTMAIHGTADPLGLLKHMQDLTVDAVFHLKDFAGHLANAAVARQFREVAQRFSRRVSTIVLTGHAMQLPGDIDHKVIHYDLQLPTPDELREAVTPVIQSLMASRNVEFAMQPEEFTSLLQSMSGMTLNQARQMIAYAALGDGALTADDIARVVDRKVQIIRDGGLLEYFPPEANQYELGGFARLKAWLDRAHVGFSPEARALNLHPPRGICIVGVQGCGKSLAAKIIAREWRLPLLKLDAGRLFDKYIGESEKNFRKAVAMAESMAPAVLWIDEIEKAMPVGGGSDQDGGLSRRLFGAFLTWLQEKKHAVFVVATANDLTNTPPELLRKGRFDEIFFVDLPDEGERHRIFEIHLALRRQDPTTFDLPHLARATEGFSGAEIEQIVIASLYRALHLRKRPDTALVAEEIGQTVPLSVAKREDIARLRALAEGRFVSVR